MNKNVINIEKWMVWYELELQNLRGVWRYFVISNLGKEEFVIRISSTNL